MTKEDFLNYLKIMKQDNERSAKPFRPSNHWLKVNAV